MKRFIRRLWNRFYWISCSIFSTLEDNFSQSKVPFPRYERKGSFYSLETDFTAFIILFLALWRIFWVDRKYLCQDTNENVHFRLWIRFYSTCCSIFTTLEVILSRSKVWLKTFISSHLNRFYCICCSIFSTLEVILTWSMLIMPRYGQKRSFDNLEAGFTAFAVLFLALWRLFWVDQRYSCQDKNKNLHSLAL